MNPSKHFTATWLALAALSLPSLAQGGYYTTADSSSLEVIPGGGTTALQNVWVGNFYGDLRADVIVRDQGYPRMFYSPSVYNFSKELSFNPTSMAVARGNAALGEADRLILSDGTGLSSAAYDANLSPSPDFVKTSAGFSNWANATKLVAVDLDLDGATDLLGIKPNGAVGIIFDFFGSATTGSDITSRSTTLDVTSVNWSGDSKREIAVLTTGGLTVYDRFGTSLASYSAMVTTGRVLAIKQSSYFERVALVYSRSNALGMDRIRVYSMSTVESPEFIALGNRPLARAVQVGDIDGDGKDDLLLSHTDDYEPEVFYNLQPSLGLPVPKTFVQGATSSEVLSGLTTTLPNPSNTSMAALADLDNDSDLDLVLPVSEGAVVHFFYSSETDADDFRTAVVSGLHTDYTYLTNRMFLDLSYQEPTNGWFGWDALETVIWRVDGGQSMTMNASALRRDYHAITGSGTQSFFVRDDVGLGDNDRGQLIMARSVKLDSSNQVIAAGPTLTSLVTGSPGIRQNLLGLGDPTLDVPLMVVGAQGEDAAPQQPGNSGATPGVDPLPDPPPPPAPDPPKDDGPPSGTKP